KTLAVDASRRTVSKRSMPRRSRGSPPDDIKNLSILFATHDQTVPSDAGCIVRTRARRYRKGLHRLFCANWTVRCRHYHHHRDYQGNSDHCDSLLQYPTLQPSVGCATLLAHADARTGGGGRDAPNRDLRHLRALVPAPPWE